MAAYHRPLGLVACLWLLSATVAAGATAPVAHPPPPVAVASDEPARWIGAHVAVAARLNDIPRSLSRLAASPYAGLGQTPWGQRLLAHLARAGGAQLAALATSVRGAAAGLQNLGDGPGITWAVATGDPHAIDRWSELLRPLAGEQELSRHGGLLTCHAPGPEPSPLPLLPAQHPDACGEFLIDPGRVLALLGVPPESGLGVAPSPRPWSVAISLDPIGVRERWEVPVRHPQQWRALTLPHAHADLLAALPADTLMAATWSADGPALIGALGASGLGDRPLLLIVADLLLAHEGLPSLLECLGGLQGDGVVWLEAGTPAPSLTVVVSMQPRLAQRLLPALAERIGMTVDAHGTLIGFLGVMPVQMAYSDGHLLLTTHPSGIAGCLDQPAGFAKDPDAAAALAELPSDGVFLAVARSGPAAEALARLALVPLAHAGMPELATLPSDLARRGRHGFCAIRQTPTGLHLEAGGLAGGPATAYAGLSAALLMTYETLVRHFEHQLAPDGDAGATDTLPSLGAPPDSRRM